MPVNVWSGLLTGSIVGRSADAIGTASTTERPTANRQNKRRINASPLLPTTPEGCRCSGDYATKDTNLQSVDYRLDAERSSADFARRDLGVQQVAPAPWHPRKQAGGQQVSEAATLTIRAIPALWEAIDRLDERLGHIEELIVEREAHRA
jgi:hypothetical protein